MISLIPESFRTIAQAAAQSCDKSFLGLPHWYKYLDGANTCSPRLNSLADVWLILLAVTDLLLRIAILVAITFVMIGGFKYITSRANPDKTTAARNTVIDALIGLVIAVVATAVVSFVAGKFSATP